MMAGMGATTGITWADRTWNPWQGCLKVSPGCDHCYMYREKRRYGHDPEVVVRSKPHTFNAPLRWNREAKAAGVVHKVFVASWADFFGAESDDWREEAWRIIKQCDSLVFQVLTKRHGRIAERLPKDWGNGYPNVWLGVSGEDQDWTNRRVAALLEVPAAVHWLSLEPQLDFVTLQDWLPDPRYNIRIGCRYALRWVVQGGESGSMARPFDLTWARNIRGECKRAGVAYFLKQMGSNPVDGSIACHACRHRPGPHPLDFKHDHAADPTEWLPDYRVQEFP